MVTPRVTEILPAWMEEATRRTGGGERVRVEESLEVSTSDAQPPTAEQRPRP